MFGFDPNVLLVITLAAIAAGALCYALLFSRIETEKKTDARLSRVKSAETDMGKVKAARDRVQEMSKRRKSVRTASRSLRRSRRRSPARSAIRVSNLALSRRACPCGCRSSTS
jgi:tight adherence protein B